jgi:hypothetical protein
MVTFEKFAEELVSIGIDENIVSKLVNEYREVKKAQLLNDYEKAISHSAKFSEAILALIENKLWGHVVNLDKIYFGNFCEKIKKYPKSNAEDEILTLAIPEVAESVYALRNKKDVAHIKTIDPDSIDSVYCTTACDWMLSELVLLFLKVDEKETYELINSVLKKKVSIIEEFEDGTIVILQKNLSRSDEILLALYHFYPQRIPNADLKKMLKLPQMYTYLERLEGEKLIHRTADGSKLTQLGIKYVEDELLMKMKD